MKRKDELILDSSFFVCDEEIKKQAFRLLDFGAEGGI